MEQVKNFGVFQDSEPLYDKNQDISSEIISDTTNTSKNVETSTTNSSGRGPETHPLEAGALNHLSKLFDSIIIYNTQDISTLKTPKCIYEQIVQEEQRQFFQPVRAKLENFLICYFSYMRFFQSTLSYFQKLQSVLQFSNLTAYNTDSLPRHMSVSQTSLELHDQLTKVFKENCELRKIIQEHIGQVERLKAEILNLLDESRLGTTQKSTEKEKRDSANKDQEIHQREHAQLSLCGQFQPNSDIFQKQIISPSSLEGTENHIQTSLPILKNLDALLELKKMVLRQQEIQELKDNELNQLRRAVIALEDQNLKLSEQNLDYEEQIENLKVQFNSMKEMHTEFRSMSERSAALQKENKELLLAIEEMNTLKELSEELEKTYISSEQKLKDELNQQQIKIKMYQYQISILESQLSDRNGLDLQKFQSGSTSKNDTLDAENLLYPQSEKSCSSKFGSKIYGKQSLLCIPFNTLKKQFKKLDHVQTIETLNFYQFFVPVGLIQRDLKFFFCLVLIKWFRESCTLLSNHMVSLFHPSLFEQLLMPTSNDEKSNQKPVTDSIFSSWVVIPLLVNIRKNASKLLQAAKCITEDESYSSYSNLYTEVLPCKKILYDLSKSLQVGESPTDQQIEELKSMHIRLEFLAQTVCSDNLALPISEQCFNQFSQLLVSAQSLIFEAINLKKFYIEQDIEEDTSFHLWLGFSQPNLLIAHLKELISSNCRLRQMSLVRGDNFQGLELINRNINSIISIINAANRYLSELRPEFEKQIKHPREEINLKISAHSEFIVSELKKLDPTNPLLSKQIVGTSETKVAKNIGDAFLQASNLLSSIEEQITLNYFNTTAPRENLPTPDFQRETFQWCPLLEIHAKMLKETVRQYSDLDIQISHLKNDLLDKDIIVMNPSENIQDLKRKIENQAYCLNGQVNNKSNLCSISVRDSQSEISYLSSLNDILKNQVENLNSQISQSQAEQQTLIERIYHMERDLQRSLDAQKSSESVKRSLYRSLTSLKCVVKYLLQKIHRTAEEESRKILEEELPPLPTAVSQKSLSHCLSIPSPQFALINAENTDNLTYSESRSNEQALSYDSHCKLNYSSNDNNEIHTIQRQLIDTVQAFNSLIISPRIVDLNIRDPTPQQQLDTQILRLLQVKASMLNLRTQIIGKLSQRQKHTSARSAFVKLNPSILDSSHAFFRSKPNAIIKFPQASTDRENPSLASFPNNTRIRTYITDEDLRELHSELIY